MSELVLEFGEALDEVLRHARGVNVSLKHETVALEDALGRVLASAVRAERDQPPFARSTRDGWAVRSADVAAGRAMRVLGCVRAGEQWRGEVVRAAEAIEIMTGAPVPEGADAVLMVEHGSVSGEDLTPDEGRVLSRGENVVPRGAEARAGAEVIPARRRVGAAEIALAASCGRARLTVFARASVAIVATGDELIELEEADPTHRDTAAMNGAPGMVGETTIEMGEAKIYNSNSYALAALVREQGGKALRLPIARDRMEDLRERIAAAGEADLLLLSGGVSMGKYDLVEQALREAGAEFFFTGAWIQPGKPVVFGRMSKPASHQASESSSQEWVYFFGLPGNPVSTEVCFRLFVAPMLRALNGQTEIEPQFVEARLAEDVKGGTRVTRFLPAVVSGDWQGVNVRVVPWQGSGDLTANARANGFVVLPGGMEKFVAGESVRVLLR